MVSFHDSCNVAISRRVPVYFTGSTDPVREIIKLETKRKNQA